MWNNTRKECFFVSFSFWYWGETTAYKLQLNERVHIPQNNFIGVFEHFIGVFEQKTSIQHLLIWIFQRFIKFLYNSNLCFCSNPLQPLYDVSYLYSGAIAVLSSIVFGLGFGALFKLFHHCRGKNI